MCHRDGNGSTLFAGMVLVMLDTWYVFRLDTLECLGMTNHLGFALAVWAGYYAKGIPVTCAKLHFA